MRIAIIHSYYGSGVPSGENTSVDAQYAALTAAGHTVLLLSRNTDLESGLSAYPARAAFRVLTGRGPDPSQRLAAFEPDVVHVHNLFPNIGSRWLESWDGPIVHTLHNFRPLCANGLLFREGATCTLCPDGKPAAAIRHGCYHDSVVASVPLAIRNSRGLGSNPLFERSDALIVLSQQARDIYATYGVSPERMSVIPNGLPRFEGNRDPAPMFPRWLGVGRLSEEKGFKELVEIWPRNVPLDIFGDGPQRAEIADTAPTSVRLAGSVARDAVRASMSGY